MGNYERFLAFEVVVNVTTKEEYEAFLKRCEELKLESVKYLKRISFEELHMNAGIRKYKTGDICIEYQFMKGFTFDDKKSYIDYGLEVITVEEFLEATK